MQRNLIRKAFRMSVHRENEAEYERRHTPIPDELARVLREHGVRDYSIFIDERDRSLFAFVAIEDEVRWAAIAETPECRRWWRQMREIMPSNPDDSPVSTELREVFHLD
jgi:L-rhamnose mutarotase